MCQSYYLLLEIMIGGRSCLWILWGYSILLVASLWPILAVVNRNGTSWERWHKTLNGNIVKDDTSISATRNTVQTLVMIYFSIVGSIR